MRASTLLIVGVMVGAAGVPAVAGATTPLGDEPEFCQPWQAASALFSSVEEVDPAAGEAALAAVSAVVPPELTDQVTLVIDAATKVLSGDPSGFESPEFGVAVTEVDGWVFDQCSFDQRYEVQAVDWAYGNIPLEIPAGTTAFRLTNLGDEVHEMTIIRKADGTTESFQDLVPLLATQDPDAMAKVEVVTGTFSPGPDLPGVAFADLAPGEYAAVCFVPVGALQEGAPDEGATAGSEPGAEAAYEPHAAHGMLQLFTVVAD